MPTVCISYHPFLRKGALCIWYCVESLALLVVSNGRAVLRLLRREARVASIGFTLLFILGLKHNVLQGNFSCIMPERGLWKVYINFMCDLGDKIYGTPIGCTGKEEVLKQNEVASGRNNVTPFKAGYYKIKELLKNNSLNKKVKLKILDELFFFDSEVEVFVNEEIFFLKLATAHIIINLFNVTCEEYCGNDERYKRLLLETIKCPGFDFYGLKETIEDLKKYSHETIKRGLIKPQEEYLWKDELTRIFHGKHNWKSNIDTANGLDYSLLKYHVICYEDRSCIREENDSLIENVSFNNIESLPDEPEVAIFSCNKLSSGKVKLFFHGVFKLDKELSLKNGSVSFKFINDTLTI